MDFDQYLYIVVIVSFAIIFVMPTLNLIAGVVSYIDMKIPIKDMYHSDWYVESCRFLMLVLSLISAVMFNFKKFFVDHFDVHHICYNEKILHYFQYIFLKFSRRCDQFFEFRVFDMYDRGIIIMFDVYLIFCIIFIFIISTFLIVIPDCRKCIIFRYENEDLFGMILSFCIGLLFHVHIIFLVFVYPFPLYGPLALLSNYGIGAFV